MKKIKFCSLIMLSVFIIILLMKIVQYRTYIKIAEGEVEAYTGPDYSSSITTVSRDTLYLHAQAYLDSPKEVKDYARILLLKNHISNMTFFDYLYYLHVS